MFVDKNMTNITQFSEEICEYGSTRAELKVYDQIAWWVEGFFLIFVGVVGILGNIASVPVLLSKEISNVFNRTLAILALVDTLFIVLDVLESIRQYHHKSGPDKMRIPYANSYLD